MSRILTLVKALNTIAVAPQMRSWSRCPSPGNKEQLRVKPDGRIFQGNTRIKVLEERVHPVNDLPRDVIP